VGVGDWLGGPSSLLSAWLVRAEDGVAGSVDVEEGERCVEDGPLTASGWQGESDCRSL